MTLPGPTSLPVAPSREDEEWLVVIDPQRIFADPESPWASPMWPDVVDPIRHLAAAYGDRVVFTRFVADPTLGGSWGPYYREWPFALVPDDDPLYAVVPELEGITAHLVTAPTFGKWGRALEAITGPRPTLTLAGVSTDCCVISTALPAADAGATVQVAAWACAGSSEQNHIRALDAMALFAPQITIV